MTGRTAIPAESVNTAPRFRISVLTLYAALFVALLPVGLILPSVHSILNRLTAVLALFTWLCCNFSGRRFIWSLSISLMLGFLVWSCITLYWADNLDAGGTVLLAYTMRFLVFLLLIPNLIRTREELNGLMHTLALSGWVLLLVSAANILFEGYTPGTRFKLLSENENALGILALLMMLGALWPALRPTRQHGMRRNILATIFLLLTMGLVAVSGSRGSAISLFVTLLAFWFWKSTRRWGKLGIYLLVLVIAVAPVVFMATFDRFVSSMEGDSRDTVLGGREVLWQAGLEIIGTYPFLGVGIGNSAFEMVPLVKQPVTSEQQEGAPAHNPVIAVWSETGLPGIVLYLGVLISACWSFVQQYRKCRDSGNEYLLPYFAIVASVFLGFMASWIKGGGMESHFTYFLFLSLLLIPASLDLGGPENVRRPAPFSARGLNLRPTEKVS